MTCERLFRRAWVVAVGLSVAACSSTAAPAPGPVVTDMATGTGGNGGGGGTQGGGGDMAMATTNSLPFVVDTVFVSSGFMGDGQTAGTIAMVPAKTGDSTDCMGMRASSSAAGSCHAVTYTPPASAGMGWGGVYWQYPANNWGTKPGFAMPSGAKKLTFQARGAKGGEKITFLAGGIQGAGNPYTDSIKASVTITLTNAWSPYEIDLSGQSYTQVLGGFGWTMAATDAGTSAAFFVDDIEWQ
jgi:hypothetical protein